MKKIAVTQATKDPAKTIPGVERFVITLDPDEWEDIRTGGFVESMLHTRNGNVYLLIQREE